MLKGESRIVRIVRIKDILKGGKEMLRGESSITTSSAIKKE